MSESAPSDERRRNDGLILGVGLLREQRARHVELAARPARIGAERADVIDGGFDLLGRSASPNAGISDRSRGSGRRDARSRPVGVGLAGGEVAVREVGKRHVETELARAAAAAVGAVTGGAGRGVDGGGSGVCASAAGRDAAASAESRGQM